MQREGRGDAGKAPPLPSCRPRRPEGRWITSSFLPPSVGDVNMQVQSLVGCLSGGMEVPLCRTPSFFTHTSCSAAACVKRPPAPPPTSLPSTLTPTSTYLHTGMTKLSSVTYPAAALTLPTLRSTPEGRWDPNKHYTHSNGILHSASAESHS